MISKRHVIAIAITFLLTSTALFSAGGKEKFQARLSAVPADARTRAALAGSGSVTATLDGNMLNITGSFDGLVSPATSANLHSAVAAGVRGPALTDLTIEKATKGTITGNVKLSEADMVHLEHNGLYVELHSEKAPEGVIWGWLIKQQ
jgi:hypothetical protein